LINKADYKDNNVESEKPQVVVDDDYLGALMETSLLINYEQFCSSTIE